MSVTKTTETVMLNRQQITQLAEIVDRFPDVKMFNVDVNHNSGIGPAIKVRFEWSDSSSEAVFDITDVTSW